MSDVTIHAHPEWEQLTKAQGELSLRKTAEGLFYEAYAAYANDDDARAARLFHEVAAAAYKEGDSRSQASSLEWEADSLTRDGKLMEALVSLGEAVQLGVEDDEVQFRLLIRQFDVANSLPIELKKQQRILRELAPFKDIRRIGDSRSMVLNSESKLLSDQGRDEEALNKALEAFTEQRDSVPSYNDTVYYCDLLHNYRSNNMASMAWETLSKWRDRGSSRFPSTAAQQLRAEGLLLFEDGHADKAWDVLQRCVSVEKQIPHFYGTIPATLSAIAKIGCATGRLLAVREAILAHRSLRNSECMWQRYSFRFECARYWCSLLESMCSQSAASSLTRSAKEKEVSPEQVARRARSWLMRAGALATELDRLLECDVKLREVRRLRARIDRASATLQLDA